MTPDEIAAIARRAVYVGYVTESMNIHCRQDRAALLVYVGELVAERTRMVAEMDQLRAEMAHALKELRDES